MRIIALLAIAIVSQATGNVLLSQGMKHIAVLNETVSSTRWIGAVLISIGVILVLWSSPRTFGLAGDRPYAVDEVGR